MVPTNTLDYSAYILKIRQADPDFVYLNLAGVDQTTFLKQYNEYGLDYPLAGGVMDTGPFWAAGLEIALGHWQSLWYHGLDNEASQAFTQKFIERNGKPPENQAWGEYVGTKILLKAISETGGTDSMAIVEYLEGGPEFDILKAVPASSATGTTSSCRRCTWSRSRSRPSQGPVGHLRGRRAAARPRSGSRADPADPGREPLQPGVMRRGRPRPAPPAATVSAGWSSPSSTWRTACSSGPTTSSWRSACR